MKSSECADKGSTDGSIGQFLKPMSRQQLGVAGFGPTRSPKSTDNVLSKSSLLTIYVKNQDLALV